MNKDTLHKLALLGTIARLREIEHELIPMFREFPDAFVGRTLPQLARPELRNGHAPGPWATTAAAPHGSKGSGDRKLVQRQQSADLLDALGKLGRPLHRKELAPILGSYSAHAIGGLARRGYIKKTKAGYVRTAKPFIVDTRKSATP